MRKITCILVVLLFVLALAVSCAAAPMKNASDNYDYREPQIGEADSQTGEESTDEEPGTNKTDGSASADDKKLSGLGDLGGNVVANTERKLVYTAGYTIETQQYVDDYGKILTAVKKYNGYVSNENSSGTPPEEYGDSGRRAELTLRIPVESYTAFTAELSGIGTTVEKSQDTEDITLQYSDVESRIDLLEMQYKKLSAHLEKATKMSDIIQLEEEMCSILNELDSLKGTRRQYDDMVNYSTINVTLREVVKQGAVSTSKQGFWERALDGLSSTLVGVGSFFESFGVFLITASPVLLILGILFAAIFVPITLSRRKKRKKAAEKNADKAQ